MLKVTGAVNVIEQKAPLRPLSPSWDVSLGRKCRARNLIGCDGDHVLLQCSKLLGMKLSDRKVLEEEDPGEERAVLVLPEARGGIGVLWARGPLQAQVHTDRL
jgi:hypothetical protein